MAVTSSTDVTTRYADSDGVSIAYKVHGDGPIDIVLVPGFVSHVDLFWEEPHAARLLRRLASFARLVVYDKRGQGLSDRTGGPPTLEESMDDLRAVMEAADAGPAVIFGISEGGPMSALFAATHPDLVSSLVLYGTFARVLASPDHPVGVPAEALDAFLEMVKTEWGGPVASDLWAPSLAGQEAFERWWARLLRFGTSPSGAVALFDLYRDLDARAILPAIHAPSLVLHRSDDRVVPVGQGRYLAEHIPDARYVELSGRDHLLTAGDQDALVDEIEEFLVGSRRAHEPERALATVLFTDIVGSTERTGELGDRRWRHLLERHNDVVRRQLAIHRGGEVKTLGDGFFATFDGPARAIRCAAAIRDDLEAIGIVIRAGIHTGEVEVIGDDLSGMAVNIGARIGALAEPGEVCVSSTVRELVVGSGLDFAERGAYDLKGAPGEWRLHAVAR
jgi:pimeloyl-ACP methyl ester carboxylesterase